jgi:hypothetical protein
MCHVAEYQRATPATSPPAGGAWIDMSGFLRSSSTPTVESATHHAGRYTGQIYWGNCDNWTAAIDGATATNGYTIAPAGAVAALCTTARPVACCE